MHSTRRSIELLCPARLGLPIDDRMIAATRKVFGIEDPILNNSVYYKITYALNDPITCAHIILSEFRND